ncbi:polysaccharide biosynthesis/export family protein [Rhabdonatronobacter sediminivivens]|nr:polysaccharide biosynthesis/export family protein [Rhabdonatronobacter sediminivivens]
MGSAAVLAGCTAVPRGAPHRREVLAGADDFEPGEAPPFTLVEVRRETLPELRNWPMTGFRPPTGWPAAGNGPTAPRIQPGDVLDLRIWDSETVSLFTADGERAIAMPGLRVSPSGHIFVPYIDEVHVAGLTTDTARRRIQEQLEAVISSVQVQLVLASGLRNSVDMVSGVANPGNFRFEEMNTSILGMISAAGGVPEGLPNPYVTLMRGGQVYGISLSEIYGNPARDIALRGRDRVIIESDKRHFIALGAAGSQQVVRFDQQEISALKAVSIMGGIDDARADPRGLLILRRYDRGQYGNPGQPATERVIFSFNLTNADGLFSADEFQIHSGDVVLATQAVATSTERVLRLFGSTLGFGARVSDIGGSSN